VKTSFSWDWGPFCTQTIVQTPFFNGEAGLKKNNISEEKSVILSMKTAFSTLG
jgi:hypothetical protein